MGKKLNFLFISKPWKSRLLKVFFFGLVLFGVYFWDFSPAALLFFFLLLFWFYFSQLPERRHFRLSFIILSLTAFLALRFSGVGLGVSLGEILIFSFLFYLLLGLGAFVFKNPNAIYRFLNTCLLLVVFLFFFGVGKSEHFLLVNLLLFLVVFFLFRECFVFFRSAALQPQITVHQPLFTALVIAFLSLELFWSISLLPIGFINSAILLTLFVFLMRDFVLAYFSGRLSRKFLIYHSLIFIILISLIFITSRWSI